MDEIDTFEKWIKAVGFILVGIVAVPVLLCIWFVYMFFWLIGYYSNEFMMFLRRV
jgi:hypothetical protein